MVIYLFIEELEATNTEMKIKVEPLYCMGQSEEFLKIQDVEYTPAKGDKLYFLPGVNIPRVKLKDLSLNHGVKVVRNIDDATHVFSGKSTKDKVTDSHWFYQLETTVLIDMLADPEISMDDYYRSNLEQALEFYKEPIVLFSYNVASIFRNSELSYLSKHMLPNKASSTNIFYTVNDDHKHLFPNILNLNILHESKLLKYINGDDATTIDETMFLQLSDMFKSSDKDNHILAMEIMANCNYMSSLLYIEMLFEKHANVMMDCHTKNHVNFKSLISFLNKHKNYLYTSIDDIMNSLMSKEVLDLEKVDIIMKYYGKEIADQGGTKHFEIKNVTLSEEIAKLLNVNYVYETFSDYISEKEVQVDMPEVHEDLTDLNSLENNSSGVAGVANDIEISDEDIEEVFTRIERNELKSELIALEEEKPVSELELNKETEPGAESNNNQIEEDDNGFEWF